MWGRNTLPQSKHQPQWLAQLGDWTVGGTSVRGVVEGRAHHLIFFPLRGTMLQPTPEDFLKPTEAAHVFLLPL